MRIFFRFFFFSALVATLIAWLYFGYVSASKREAVLIEDRYKGIEAASTIHPGSLRFIPSRIFPGRILLHRVRLFPRFLELHFKKALEQSEVLGLDDSFYIQVVLDLDYKLNSKNLHFLFQKLKRPEWEALETYLKLRLRHFLDQRMKKLYKGDTDLEGLREKLHAYWKGLALDEFNKEFSKEGVEFISIISQKTYVPDPERYASILSAGSQIVRQKLERIRIVNLAQAHREAREIENQSDLVRLEKIAKLLEVYPHLRDYLAIDRLGKNVEVMVMPSEHWFSSSNSTMPLSRPSPNPKKKDTQKKKSFWDRSSDSYGETKSGNSSFPKNENYLREKGQFTDLGPP